MIDKILVMIDESEVSLRGLTQAKALAEQLGASLVLLHVLEPLPTYTINVANYLPEGEMERAAVEYGQQLLTNASHQLGGAGNVETVLKVAKDRIWREVLAVTSDADIDLIVMGTHGREGIERAILGSVAEKIARHASVPVMLVR